MLEKAIAAEITGDNPWEARQQAARSPLAGANVYGFAWNWKRPGASLWVHDLFADGGGRRRGGKADRCAWWPCRPAWAECSCPSETPAYKVSVWATQTAPPGGAGRQRDGGRLLGRGTGPAAKRHPEENRLQGPGVPVRRGVEAGIARAGNSGVSIACTSTCRCTGRSRFRYTIGLAKLPEASTRKLPPESVPFTIRNWDNRIKDYFYLTDRIGFRMLGVWGGWGVEAPLQADRAGHQVRRRTRHEVGHQHARPPRSNAARTSGRTPSCSARA